jgi:Uma2 family endonuclease
MSTLTAPSKASKTTLMMTENWLRTVFSSGLYTVEQRPAFPEADGEQPPALVVTHRHPTNDADCVPVLVVEVSDAPIAEYPGEDAGRFAAAGVRDYWVIEVSARKLHVHRDPQPDEAKHGASYKQVRAFSQNSLISPLIAELHLAQVINLLPW